MADGLADGAMSDEELLACWLLVTQSVARTQHRVSEQVEQSGIPAQWLVALHLLFEAPGRRLPMSRLARDLGMSSGGFTKLADRMARDGLIDRRGSSADRRVVYATLTPDGARMARQADESFATALREHVLGVVTEADLLRISNVARILGEHHEAAREEEPEPMPTTRDPSLPDRRRTRDEQSDSRDEQS
jgi:DNA-binding MarR family transcriptional regulator